MFAARYYAGRYYARRYFPAVGADAGAPTTARGAAWWFRSRTRRIAEDT